MSGNSSNRPPSAAEKFAGHQFESGETDRASPIDRARLRSRENFAIDLVLSSGRRRSFEYTYLMDMEFDPGDSIRLHFANASIEIQGRNLEGLYELLLDHRVRSIYEGDEHDDAGKPETAEHVDQIVIEEGKERE